MIKTLIEVLLSAVVLAAAEVTDTPIPPTTKYEYPPEESFSTLTWTIQRKELMYTMTFS